MKLKQKTFSPRNALIGRLHKTSYLSLFHCRETYNKSKVMFDVTGLLLKSCGLSIDRMTNTQDSIICGGTKHASPELKHISAVFGSEFATMHAQLLELTVRYGGKVTDEFIGKVNSVIPKDEKFFSDLTQKIIDQELSVPVHKSAEQKAKSLVTFI